MPLGMMGSDPLYNGSLWYVGIICAAVASFCGALGDCVVRLSFLRERHKDHPYRPLFKRPLWLAGMFCSIICNPVLTLISLRFAAASAVMPFAGMHILWSVFLARCIIGEVLHILDTISCLLIVLGVTLTILFGATDIEYALSNSYGWIIYSAICFLILGVCILVSLPVRFMISRTTLMVRQICATAVAGVTGANTNVCAKGAIMLIGAVIEGNTQSLKEPTIYIMTSVTILMASLQVFYLNYCLYKYRATFVIPMINTILIVTGSLGAIIIFNEIPKQIPLFTMGITLVIVGIYTLSQSPNHTTEPYGEQTEQISINGTEAQTSQSSRHISTNVDIAPLIQNTADPEYNYHAHNGTGSQHFK